MSTKERAKLRNIVGRLQVILEELERMPKGAQKVVPNIAERIPPNVTGAYYNRVSSGLFENVNKVLSGEESAKDAVSQIERVAKRIVP